MTADCPLFEPFGWGVVRAPLLPVDATTDGSPQRLIEGTLVPSDARIRAAIAVGSYDLAAALRAPPASARGMQRLRGKLMRYLIRMSTRSAPYGLFAGVEIVRWGSVTDVAITAGPIRTRTRPDTGRLLELVSELELQPPVLRALRLVANPLLLERAGWVFLGERLHLGGSRNISRGQARVRATPGIRRALFRARRPVPYEEIARDLLRDSPTTPVEVDRRVETLCRESFLLTDLRPPLTGPSDPAQHVLERLPAIAETRRARGALGSLMRELERWDSLPTEDRFDGWQRLADHAARLAPASQSRAVAQVDMALPVAGVHVHGDVAREAARAAELLLRLSPHPGGPPHITAYRRRFVNHYGPDTEVPLLELLDRDFGLGPPDERDLARTLREPAAVRRQALLDLALSAVRDHRLVAELDDDWLARLSSCSPMPDTAPASLDICVSVAAASAAAIDAGNFAVVVGPHPGGESAGCMLGRFGQLLGARAHEALEDVVCREERVDGRLRVELVYLPQLPETANIAIRPAVGRHEIVAGVTPGVRPERVIPLDELLVGVRHDRFYIRRSTSERDIVVSELHMLNPLQAPAAMRFLHDIGQDGRVVFSAFDWGPASEFGFLPRVQHGRVVLVPAQWRLDGLVPEPARDFREALAAWRERWSVPRWVYLAEADNRLLIDLDNPTHVGLLQDDLRDGAERRHLVLQEALPGPTDGWLPGPDGGHVAELVVPLIAGSASVHQDEHSSRGRTAVRASPSSRLRPPGSDWLFLKLYCHSALEDEIIGGHLLDLVAFAEAAKLINSWFFIRFADPMSHLRVRFHGEPEHLAQLFPHVCRWAMGLVTKGSCFRFSFDTYEREVERYGGELGVRLAEEIFAADSRAIAELLYATSPQEPTRTSLGVLTADTLLSGLGVDAAERLSWYRAWAPLTRADGEKYRERRDFLRRLLADESPAAPGWTDLARLMDDYRRALGRAATGLDALMQVPGTAPRRASLCRSYVHMHCNRLLGKEDGEEQLVLQLLRRTRESLSYAP